jgi:hypothetical protein
VSRFQKAVASQKYLKMALYGAAGSGKTLTSLLIAEGLANGDKKRIAYVDTELGTEFYAQNIPARTGHPKAFDFDRVVTRSVRETLAAVSEIDPKEHSVIVIDSLTHLWESAGNAYTGKKTSGSGIAMQAWGEIKKPYKKLISTLLDSEAHVIICGREGLATEETDDGEMKIVGRKMKSEGETQYEPHILGRMIPEREKSGEQVIRIFFEKDRSGVLSGKTFTWPNFATIQPVIDILNDKAKAKRGAQDATSATDAAAIEAAAENAKAERMDLYNTIRTALSNARNADELKAAWSLTAGKKTKLGDYFEQLEALKDQRKSEILAEVA